MKPWERQLREGAQAFAAFSKFLELGPDRTLVAIAQDPTLGLSEAKVRALSRKWNWRERAASWEELLADASRKRAQKILENDAEKWARRRVELREKEYTTAEKLLKRADEILDLDIVQKVVRDSVTIINQKGEEITIPVTTIYEPIKVSQKDAASALHTASQIMRLSSEMETSRDRLDVNVSDETKKIELAQTALQSIRDELMERLIKEHPELVPDAMRLLPGWVANSFQIKPELLEAANPEGSATSESASNEIDDSAPSPEQLLSPQDEDSVGVIDAEYVDLPRPEAQ